MMPGISKFLRRTAFVGVSIGLMALGACQSSGTAIPTQLPTASQKSPPTQPPLAPFRTISVTGQFVFAPGDGSIWIQDASTFVVKNLLKQNATEYYEAPSFSPDGSQIVFVAYTFDASGAQIKEIRAMTSDGSNARTLFKIDPNGPRMYLGDPRYSPDGSEIYFTATSQSAQSARARQDQIVKGPASGGDWKKVLDDGQQPALARDGRRLAFLRFNPIRASSSLWIANPDGSSARQLLADDVFAGLLGERFSPDGQWLVVAASGPPTKQLPGMAERKHSEDACEVGIFFSCLVEPIYADGLPWEIWLVAVDGTSFKQLTRLGLDSPYPAFSKDGRYIAFISINGLVVYDRASDQLSLLDRERVHGILDWFQR